MADRRGIPHIAVESCKGCGLCVSVCPEAVLSIDESRVNLKGYYPVTVESGESCIGCLSCALICPDVTFTIELLDDR
ncbi:MAG: 4Fe-4S binding protein [Desulfofustis sp.]|nr:4Fe-4S binding protein [Desulfofustis sp.]